MESRDAWLRLLQLRVRCRDLFQKKETVNWETGDGDGDLHRVEFEVERLD